MNTHLRIGMLIGRFYPVEGGAEIQCRRLSTELSKKNQHVFILTQSLPRVPVNEKCDCLSVYRVGLPWNGKLGSLSYVVSGFIWLLKNRKLFDILHVHMASSPALLAGFAGWILRKPVVVKFAGSRRTGDIQTSSATWYGRCKLRLLKRMIRRFVCPSNEIRHEMVAWGFDAGRIAVIPNGIDTDVFSPVTAEEKAQLRGELCLPADGFVAVFSGRLQAGKGLDILVPAWDTLARNANDRGMMLLIIGRGPLEQTLADHYGCLESVRFLGWKNTISKYLQAADLFVLPSFGEGMPNALVEAMSCGLPCVATRIGGITELVADGENGVLVEPGDGDALQKTVKELYGNKTLRDGFGMRARITVVERLSISLVADTYLALYQAALQK